MAETTERAQLGREDVLFEESFLLQVQCCIQGLLNDKRLKYRDLSKRLGVSEARVSQMFGDDASNLTIRTIARIFYQLGEKPVLLSERQCDRLGSADAHLGTDAWTMVATDVDRFEVARAQVIEMGEERAEPRAVPSSEWLEGVPLLSRAG